MAHQYLGDWDAAAEVAGELVDTERAGEAHRILSVVARAQGNLPAAIAHAQTAATLHRGDARQLARDRHALSAAYWELGAYADALREATAAAQAAADAGDARMRGYAVLARADILRELGDRDGANAALEEAARLVSTDSDRAWVLLKRGILEVELGHWNMARRHLHEVLGVAGNAQPSDVAAAAHLNLAWVARAEGRFDTALAHLAAANLDVPESKVIAALVAAGQNELARAEMLLTEAEARTPSDASWSWLVPVLLGELAELRGDLPGAELAYRRAVAAATRVRSASPRHAASLLAAHRRPYEGLFSVLAKAGKWVEAVEVVLELDAGDMLQVSDVPGEIGPGGMPSAAAAGGGQVLLPLGAPRATVSAREALEAWRGRDLVIVVPISPRIIRPGAEEVWRMTVSSGEVFGESVGASNPARALVDRLAIDLADDAAARAVSQLIVPPGEKESAPLYVLLTGFLGKVPLAALRSGDSLTVRRRPLIRVLGMHPRRAPAYRPGPPIVLGDPGGDLPAAAREARAVAAVLDVSPRLGNEVTVAALTGAGNARLLHVAGHARDAALQLADGALSARQIVDLGVHPRVVVLATCGSAAARDEGGWGSLAAAFLAAGSEYVVAAHWSVPDAAAAELVTRFYRAGGHESPAQALAQSQVAVSNTQPPSSWAAFTVLGAPPRLQPTRAGEEDDDDAVEVHDPAALAGRRDPSAARR